MRRWIGLLCLVGAGVLSAGTGAQPRLSPAVDLPALHAEPDPAEGGRIVDALGREVLLRGVNVNALVEYWQYDPDLFTVYPFTEEDADAIAWMGWNVVRLAVSWSRIEPEPGVYDERYLARIDEAIRILAQRGIYSIIDLHQDAWGPSLAARDDETCGIGARPAFGWDGAPAWATLDRGAPRCESAGTRELSPAVLTAFQAFWNDAPGPDGTGIRSRYVAMLRHLAARLSANDAVAGYDVMNEPNVIFQSPSEVLSVFYAEALAALREGEGEVDAPRRLVFFEPSIVWADFGGGVPGDFVRDDQVVYAPHLYQGGISSVPLEESVFQKARDEAAVFGGAPVLSGEWGADPRRAQDPTDGYFGEHQRLQDRFRFHATLWTWREACGDPHKAREAGAGQVPFVWGLFEVDCVRNEVLGMRQALVRELRRPFLRAAPGAIEKVGWEPAPGRFEASGEDAARGTPFEVFFPSPHGRRPRLRHQGLVGVHARRGPGDAYRVVGRSRGGPWQLVIESR